jgi:hypothetical protein
VTSKGLSLSSSCFIVLVSQFLSSCWLVKVADGDALSSSGHLVEPGFINKGRGAGTSLPEEDRLLFSKGSELSRGGTAVGNIIVGRTAVDGRTPVLQASGLSRALLSGVDMAQPISEDASEIPNFSTDSVFSVGSEE